MIPIISDALLTASGSLAGSMVAKATVVAALGLIGARLAHKNRAAVRHALLAATFGVMLLLPVASLVAPPVRIAVAVRNGTVLPPPGWAVDEIPPVTPANVGVWDCAGDNAPVPVFAVQSISRGLDGRCSVGCIADVCWCGAYSLGTPIGTAVAAWAGATRDARSRRRRSPSY
jgi:hypothetical protein